MVVPLFACVLLVQLLLRLDYIPKLQNYMAKDSSFTFDFLVFSPFILLRDTKGG